MATVPKWQQPLAARAEKAEWTLRAAMLAPGGAAGAMAAAASADQDLAELSREFAARTSSPLLKQLLVHGARALAANAGVLLASTIDPDDLVVAARVEVDEDQPDEVPVENQYVLADDRRTSDWDGTVWPPRRPFEADPVDEDQALVEPTPEPVVTSDDATANVAEVASTQASPAGGEVVGGSVPWRALTPGTPVEIVAGVLLGHAGVVADPPEVVEYAGEEPGARVWVETAGGDRVSPLVTDLRIARHDSEIAVLRSIAVQLAERAGQAVHERVCDCRNQGFGYTLRTRDLAAIGPAAAAAVLRTLRVLVDIGQTPATRAETSVWLSDLATGLELGDTAFGGGS